MDFCMDDEDEDDVTWDVPLFLLYMTSTPSASRARAKPINVAMNTPPVVQLLINF